MRFDLENCDWVCAKCHFFVENGGQKTLEEWKRKQLGEQAYKMLLVRANSYGKKDDSLTTIVLKQLLKKYDN